MQLHLTDEAIINTIDILGFTITYKISSLVTQKTLILGDLVAQSQCSHNSKCSCCTSENLDDMCSSFATIGALTKAWRLPPQIATPSLDIARKVEAKYAAFLFKQQEISELPLDRFVNYPSSFEVDRGISNALCSESKDKEEDIERTLSVIIDKCKHIYADKRNKAIGKKSISFLMKKIFVCRSRNCPTPSLRDTLQESRMEKPSFEAEKYYVATVSSLNDVLAKLGQCH
ncbi:hypothetical protein JHK82_024942 [Glycine max]|nr:hypothetical protein JHK82_024942 [Glycine max]